MSGNQVILLLVLFGAASLINFFVTEVWPAIVYGLKAAVAIGLALLVIQVVGSLFKKGRADADAPGRNVPAGTEGNAAIVAAIVLLAVVAVLLLAVLIFM